MNDRTIKLGGMNSKPADLAVAAEAVEREAWLDLFEAVPRQVREGLSLYSARIGSMGLLAGPTIPIVEFNRAMSVEVDGPPSDEELDAAAAWLDQHAAPGWALQVAPTAGTSSFSRFSNYGYEASGAGWAKFVQALPPSNSWMPRDPATARLVDTDEAVAFGSVIQRGFELPDDTSTWFAALVGRPGWHCFISTDEGAPIGAAAMFVASNLAWAGMCTTLPRHRGKGVQRDLIAARLNAAVVHGAVAITSETGRPSSIRESGYSSYRNQERGFFGDLR